MSVRLTGNFTRLQSSYVTRLFPYQFSRFGFQIARQSTVSNPQPQNDKPIAENELGTFLAETIKVNFFFFFALISLNLC